MPFTQAGLPDSGRTTHFEFNYEDSLSDARGKDLVTAVMSSIEGDWLWLRSFFTGQFFNPLNGRVYIHVHQRTSPTDPLGASWEGLGLVPFNVEIWLGEVPLFGIAPADEVRLDLIAELSEMLMRDSRTPGAPNPWFGFTNEGNKGEALSRAFVIEFLRARLPGTTTTGFASVSSVWLDAPPRSDFVSTNAEDIAFDARTGCGTLFLMFLHDELGFSLEQIISNGATETRGFPSTGTLADVYQNLTGQPASGAFTQFSDLVNLHYPPADGPYGAPLDTVFPVPDLAWLNTESSRLTWGVSNGPPAQLYVEMTKPAVVRTTVHLTSSDPGVLPVPPTALVLPRTDVCAVPLPVTPQSAAFAEKVVTLTVTYAGKTLTHAFTVVRPEDLLPPLQIVVVESDDRCARLFQEGDALTLRVDNVGAFVDRRQLTYAWAVTGAAAAVLDAPVLEIAALPPAGTTVKVSVQVTNDAGVTGHGELDFTVLAPLPPLDELDRRVRCIVATMIPYIYIPPEVPVEVGPLTVEHVAFLRLLLDAQRGVLTDLNKSLHELEVAQRR